MRNSTLKLFVACGLIVVAGVCDTDLTHAQMRVPPSSVVALATQPGENAPLQETNTSTWVPQPVSQAQAAQPVMPQQVIAPQTVLQPMPQPGMVNGVIVIPVIVQQYVTYTPPPVTMMVSHPAQLVIPQQPVPMMPQMVDPMAMQMMQQQMFMHQQVMMQQQQMMPMMPPQAQPQQPIPIKMILPDGSKVSIKHYVPGSYFKNAIRAITP